MTVPAAIRELEKIEMTRQLDKVYRLDHAVTKAQKMILSAFDIEASHVKYKAAYISEQLSRKQSAMKNSWKLLRTVPGATKRS